MCGYIVLVSFFSSPGAFFRYIGIGVGGPVAGWLGG